MGTASLRRMRIGVAIARARIFRIFRKAALIYAPRERSYFRASFVFFLESFVTLVDVPNF